jgi:hypothetical protein
MGCRRYLRHRGGVDVELDRGLAPSENVTGKLGGMSMTTVYLPAFISGTTSRSAIGCGGWKYGGRNACAIRRDSSEWSSSRIAIDALCTS